MLIIMLETDYITTCVFLFSFCLITDGSSYSLGDSQPMVVSPSRAMEVVHLPHHQILHEEEEDVDDEEEEHEVLEEDVAGPSHR